MPRLTEEVGAIKSGEAIHNASLMEELRRAVAKARGDLTAESLSKWLPTKDDLMLAATGTMPVRITSAKPAAEAIQPTTQLKEGLPFPTHHSAPAVSSTDSTSPTTTPTPSVVVNGEILKAYPRSMRYQSEPTNEVPPLQIQPKKRRESPGFPIGGPDLSSSAELKSIHTGRVIDEKREGSLPKQLPRRDLPGRVQHDQANSQEIGRVRKAATASPSPSVSEHSVSSRPPRLQSVGALASTPAKKHVDERGNTPVTTVPKGHSEPFSPPVSQLMMPVKKEGSPATLGVYTHRKIPVKNAASTPTIARTPSLGDKRSLTTEEISTTSAKESEIVPDSQEVPDSQDEVASERPSVKGRERKASKIDGLNVSPVVPVRTTRRTDRQLEKTQSPSRTVKRESEKGDQREVADSDSDRSELTTPPASPALSLALSPVVKKVKGESDDVDVEKATSSELSPVVPTKPLTGRKASRTPVKEESEKAVGKRGRKRGRESENGDPSTPAKRPNQKSGNTMSQDELSPAPSPGGSTEYRRADTDDTDGTDPQQKKVRLRSSDMEDEGADVPRRGLKRRMSTRGKPPTIDEDSEVDGNTSGRGRGSVERSATPRGNKDGDQSSRRNAYVLLSIMRVHHTKEPLFPVQ
ncbi:hypothetical protein QFC22_001583 [Naganishia vaughanmartiniae]|uniref:Uncharacterized protein n=1 Tax=Naganishia vaughanmartiniae TaxID=1424756 RepID=A0ACC2XH74_9TREE|nr:hypothetical protein QFC22_001583 [Naganishia vaughanmartiniae]